MRIIFIVLPLLFLNFGCINTDLKFPENKDILTKEFSDSESFFPLATIDLSNKGIKDKIHIIFVSFNYNGKLNDENFPKNESMGNFTFKIKPNGLFEPTFSKNALKIDSEYKKYFIENRNKYLKAKSENINVFGFIDFFDEPEWWQSDETPINSKGEKFKFICQFEMNNICDDDCCVYVFYDESDKEVKYVHQYD
ncbi:hypothetical protein [Flavobacterium sp.]|uniref:hypothetical protein n=1 Tax=Flavobacterium sp. TaxID=239 RepID=UPI0040482509